MFKNDIRKYFQTSKLSNHSHSQNHQSVDKHDINKSNMLLTQPRADEYLVFTDGSSFNNGSRTKKHYGGIGIYVNDIDETISESLNGAITNNIAELKACIRAILIVTDKTEFEKLTNKINNKNIVIYTDSQYVINCITKWYKSWVKNDWKKYNFRTKKTQDVKNRDLIEILYSLSKKFNIQLRYSKAHGIEPDVPKNTLKYVLWYGNNIADIQARKGTIESKNTQNKISTNFFCS